MLGLLLFILYTTSTILTKLLYIAMYTTLQMIEIYFIVINHVKDSLTVYLNDSLTWETLFKNLIPKLNTPVSAEPRVYLGILFTSVTVNLD